jgi:predicted ArsR family transcriptional regulator
MVRKTEKADVHTRQTILRRLKEGGPSDAAALADGLGITAMAVRQHLYTLADEGFVTYEEEPRPKGRPAKMWAVTHAADQHFPDSHADLTRGLIRAMKKAFGASGLEKLLTERAREQVREYRKRISASDTVRRRVGALARIRTDEGYMASVDRDEDGALLLVENHCPICEAATECQGLCAKELEVFQESLGKDVHVERTDHIQAGARRCAYRIVPSE